MGCTISRVKMRWTRSRVEMEASSSTDLPESIFFTARKARIRSNTQDASSSSKPASSPREYFSARIHSMMELKSELSMSREDAEIEASKDHWTVVEPKQFTASLSTSGSVSQGCTEALTESERVSLYEENLKEMVRLQEANPESKFFQIGEDGLVLGKKIGEGGQAEIYEAGYSLSYGPENVEFFWVLKVFKAGISVGDLQSQWPLAFLHRASWTNIDRPGGLYNPVLRGRLLEDGRFAFEMARMWGDLRKWLDVRMEHNGNRHPPFMMPDGNYHECCMLSIMKCIVIGMGDLHEQGIVHRDLKASNVLTLQRKSLKLWYKLDPIDLEHNIACLVTDYECSIGCVGTGYWRAPEILQALKNGSVNTTPDLFTQEADVYSFAMTCYEVLTGCVPFEEVGAEGRGTLVDDILRGRRPTLPSYLQPWMVDMMNKCWHMDPLERHTFKEIESLLYDIEGNACRSYSKSKFFKIHV